MVPDALKVGDAVAREKSIKSVLQRNRDNIGTDTFITHWRHLADYVEVNGGGRGHDPEAAIRSNAVLQAAT